MNKRLFNQQPNLSRMNMSTARNGQSTTQTTFGQPASFKPAPLIESLRNQIRKLETASRPSGTRVASTGCFELDQLLPERGLATGTINEWLTPAAGYGAELLSLLAAKEACIDGGALVVIDSEQRFNPAAAAAWGINLDNVIVLREGGRKGIGGRNAETQTSNLRSQTEPISNLKSEISNSSTARTKPSPPISNSFFPTSDLRPPTSSTLWAIDQALRCPAVAAVWGSLGHVHERWLRRFQLSAEQSGAVGLFVRPLSMKGQPGWSEVQWEVGREKRIGGRRSEWEGGQHVECGMQSAECGISNSAIARTKPRPPVSSSSLPTSDLRPPISSSPSFDRLIPLRLLRVRGGQAATDKTIQVRIDFTTGKAQTVTENNDQKHEQLNQKTDSPKKHSLRLASQLAHPKTGRRQRRA